MRANASKAETVSLGVYIRAITISVVVGILISFLLLLVFSIVLNAKDFPHSIILPLSIAALAFGSFGAGLTGAKIVRKNGLIIGCMAGAFIAALLLAASAIAIKEPFSVLSLVKFGIAVIVAGVGGVLGVNKRKKR